MHRREFVKITLGTGAALGALPSLLHALAAPEKLTVYKSASCGCCGEWVKYMRAQGFAVSVVDMDDLSDIKRSSGVPVKLQSCHTALVGAYVIEGHVPADLVRKILAEKPGISGLAAPGMPADAPGMGTGKTPYEVISWDRAGKTSVFARR
jgi:hypothetical protein